MNAGNRKIVEVATNLPKNCGIWEVSKKRKQVRHGKLA